MLCRRLMIAVGCLGIAAGASSERHAVGQEPALVPPAAMGPDGAPLLDAPPPGMPYEQLPAELGGPSGYGAPVGLGSGQPGVPSYIDQVVPIPKAWLKSRWNPQPKLEARIEALFLQPNFRQTTALFSQFQATDNSNFVGEPVSIDVGDRWITSGRAAVEYHFNEAWSMEAAGFWLDGPKRIDAPVGGTDGTLFLDPAQGGFFELDTLPRAFPRISDNASVDWIFQAENVDFTMMRHYIPLKGPVSDYALGIGARYFHFEETVNLQINDQVNGNFGALESNVDNVLAGPQVQARMRFNGPWTWMRLSTELKVGLMANQISTTNSVFTDEFVRSSITYERNQFAGLFEGNFFFEFFLHENASFFAGYHLFYADLVDRASEQLTGDLSAFVTDQDNTGSLWMHGPRAGLTISF
ncbi:MAG: hypothetical protein ACRC1K_19220 [Planctomycetia bacterium]